MSDKLTNTSINSMINSSIPSGLNSKLNYIIYGIIFGASTVILMTSGSQGDNAVMSFINGYRALLCSIIFMFSLIWYRASGVSFYRLSISLLPFIILMIIITWLLVLLNKYYDRIIGNQVSDYYVSFVNISTVLTLVQLVMLVNAVRDSYFENNKSIQPKIFSVLMLLGTINFIMVITLGVILKSYVTDC
jgi:hypothetical protein